MRIITTWNWNAKLSAIWWVSSFMAFGPLQLLLGNGQYKGSIFSYSPFLYFITQGLFIATFSVVFISLVHWIWKKRREKSLMTL